jgi:hypothetical protein
MPSHDIRKVTVWLEYVDPPAGATVGEIVIFLNGKPERSKPGTRADYERACRNLEQFAMAVGGDIAGELGEA